jgi:uncharacterized protein YcaQ
MNRGASNIINVELSADEARRLGLAAQGFGAKPTKATMRHVKRLATKVHAFQIDSVNVLVRAHYLPAYSRLGPYSTTAIDTLAYKRRELFECWGKAACLFPVALYPLFRFRMDAAKSGNPRSPSGSYPDSAYIEKAYNEVGERGPITASELSNPGERRGKWWGWNAGKIALEHLFNAGLVAISGRRGFTRLYDITERVIPADVLDAPYPDADEAKKELICLAASAYGVGTIRELTGYFGVDVWDLPRGNGGKRPKRVGPRLAAELVDEGRLVPVTVEGWKEPAYMSPGVRHPRSVDVRALLGPFDSMMWRDTERLFGFTQHLAQQLYVPAERRMYGYYVLPFLLGDMLVGRCDLKADRQRRVLMVQSAHLQHGQDRKRVAAELASELKQMKEWLELDSIEVAGRGDLAASLKRSVP